MHTFCLQLVFIVQYTVLFLFHCLRYITPKVFCTLQAALYQKSIQHDSFPHMIQNTERRLFVFLHKPVAIDT